MKSSNLAGRRRDSGDWRNPSPQRNAAIGLKQTERNLAGLLGKASDVPESHDVPKSGIGEAISDCRRVKQFFLASNTGNKGTLLRPWPDARMAAQLDEAAVVFPID